MGDGCAQGNRRGGCRCVANGRPDPPSARLALLPDTIVTTADMAWGAVAGLAGGSGVALLYRALALGPMSVVAPLTAVSAALPVFTGLALGERLSVVTTLGIALAAIAIVLIGQEQGSVPRSLTQQATARGLALSIVAGLLVGVFFISLERTSAASGLWPLVPARVVAISLFAGSALAGGRPVLVPRSVAGIAVGAGALDMLANALFLIAVQQGPLSVVATRRSTRRARSSSRGSSWVNVGRGCRRRNRHRACRNDDDRRWNSLSAGHRA